MGGAGKQRCAWEWREREEEERERTDMVKSNGEFFICFYERERERNVEDFLIEKKPQRWW